MLLNGSPTVSDETCEEYGYKFAELLKQTFKGPREPRRGTLRMSSIGKPCERQLYYSVNNTDEAEPLRPEAHMKFFTGHVLELVMLFLAEASGHVVEGTQDTQEIEGIKGHRDAVIDGTLVDVKSASTYSFQKFKTGALEQNDSFGYVTQLQSYLYAGQTDDKITDKNRAAFLVVDKTLGHICLDIHERKNIPYDSIYRHKKEMVSSSSPPPRAFEPEPMGKSGNMSLGIQCGYCDYKHKCHPGLRTFLYSNGPKHLTTVTKIPDVPELT